MNLCLEAVVVYIYAWPCSSKSCLEQPTNLNLLNYLINMIMISEYIVSRLFICLFIFDLGCSVTHLWLLEMKLLYHALVETGKILNAVELWHGSENWECLLI